ncbi:hypothetical protein HanRHA438_Chr07g0309851 [Helianthus annuus]|uniref:Uncharacterized protein n=1 Tax=Helianthus annuus TaxID=4232 RepID=A0A251TAK3_HELAN|nr:hypothetical protein HanXRQr2_Chr07g0299641 [Helianthus annuus]KAJ0557277.1 hypothetical protein HanIR_Chr07g0323381 [Helianthus annuus]KAJ0563478.1 hypothetical protein HanHA89_Chr07g0263641 [Helianthus annuus]KAJ0728815.1 hypothetical protein HanLR1_Chr07g0246001 [Helianthus annuus]KAJ0731573.1 hypothetical protein HanOQP8_Chr07g0253571 [Helianthus annuus]
MNSNYSTATTLLLLYIYTFVFIIFFIWLFGKVIGSPFQYTERSGSNPSVSFSLPFLRPPSLFSPSPTSSHQFFSFKFIRHTATFEGAGEQYEIMTEGDLEPATGPRRVLASYPQTPRCRNRQR